MFDEPYIPDDTDAKEDDDDFVADKVYFLWSPSFFLFVLYVFPLS